VRPRSGYVSLPYGTCAISKTWLIGKSTSSGGKPRKCEKLTEERFILTLIHLVNMGWTKEEVDKYVAKVERNINNPREVKIPCVTFAFCRNFSKSFTCRFIEQQIYYLSFLYLPCDVEKSQRICICSTIQRGPR
jgi:hypothetical protein